MAQRTDRIKYYLMQNIKNDKLGLVILDIGSGYYSSLGKYYNKNPLINGKKVHKIDLVPEYRDYINENNPKEMPDKIHEYVKNRTNQDFVIKYFERLWQEQKQ